MPMLQVQVQRKQFERRLGQIHLLILKSFPGRQEATETPPTTTTEAEALEPMLHNKRSPCDEKPALHS